MLVLAREVGQSIEIGPDIEVFLVGVRGEKARIGVKAPKEIPVHRSEIARAIEREGPVMRSLATSEGRMPLHRVLHSLLAAIHTSASGNSIGEAIEAGWAALAPYGVVRPTSGGDAA